MRGKPFGPSLLTHNQHSCGTWLYKNKLNFADVGLDSEKKYSFVQINKWNCI